MYNQNLRCAAFPRKKSRQFRSHTVFTTVLVFAAPIACATSHEVERGRQAESRFARATGKIADRTAFHARSAP